MHFNFPQKNVKRKVQRWNKWIRKNIERKANRYNKWTREANEIKENGHSKWTRDCEIVFGNNGEGGMLGKLRIITNGQARALKKKIDKHDMCSKVWCVTCDSVQTQNIVCKLGLKILIKP